MRNLPCSSLVETSLCIKEASNNEQKNNDNKEEDEEWQAEKKQWDSYFRMQKWNKIFLASCVIGVCIDPLFLYIPITNQSRKCVEMDLPITIVAIVLRSLTDLIHVVHIFYELYFAWSKANKPGYHLLPDFLKSSRLAVPPHDFDHIPVRGFGTFTWHLLVDFLALIPFPQVIILFYFPKIAGSVCKPLSARKFLNMLLLFQYLPRVYRVYLSGKELGRTFDPLSQHLWVRGAFNFFLYVIFAHIIGGLWYFYSMYRETGCWHHVLDKELRDLQKYHSTRTSSLACSDNELIWNLSLLPESDYININKTIDRSCPVDPDDKLPNNYDFGIYADAIKARILKTTKFTHKFFHSFWWGLRNLSSFGGNLETSGDLEENIFATFISIMGLLLFLYLIGNLQTYIQSETKKSVKIRERLRVKEKELLYENSNYIPSSKEKIFMVHLRNSIKKSKRMEVDKVFSLLKDHNLENDERFVVWASKMLDKEKHEKSKKDLEADLWIENSKISDEERQPMKKNIMEQLRKRLPAQSDHDPDVTNILPILPPELGRKVKKHLCFPILKKIQVGMLNKSIDEELAEIFYGYLKPMAYPENSYMIRQGEPLDLMLLITQGSLWTFGSSCDVKRLERGDYYGNELLECLITKRSKVSSKFPISDRSVKVHKKVEGFVLMADDLERLLANYWWKFRPSSAGNSAAIDAFMPFAVVSMQRLFRRAKEAKLLKSEKQISE